MLRYKIHVIPAVPRSDKFGMTHDTYLVNQDEAKKVSFALAEPIVSSGVIGFTTTVGTSVFVNMKNVLSINIEIDENSIEFSSTEEINEVMTKYGKDIKQALFNLE